MRDNHVEETLVTYADLGELDDGEVLDVLM